MGTMGKTKINNEKYVNSTIKQQNNQETSIQELEDSLEGKQRGQ